jgi:hypothetical protein
MPGQDFVTILPAIGMRINNYSTIYRELTSGFALKAWKFESKFVVEGYR